MYCHVQMSPLQHGVLPEQSPFGPWQEPVGLEPRQVQTLNGAPRQPSEPVQPLLEQYQRQFWVVHIASTGSQVSSQPVFASQNRWLALHATVVVPQEQLPLPQHDCATL